MKHYSSLITSLICLSMFITQSIYSQENQKGRTNQLKQSGKTAFQTIPAENNSAPESLDEHLIGNQNVETEKFVLGGTVLWNTQDPTAIANFVALNSVGDRALTGWGLNSMRATLYSDANNTPLWDFFTGQYDPAVDISGDGNKIAITAGTHFYLLNPSNGNIDFQFALPDTFYASGVSVSRDGSMALVLASAWGNSTTYRAYAFDISGSPTIMWTFDVQTVDVTNWAGVNFSSSGDYVAITGRYHLYVLNSSDGSLIWSHFLDNTESAPAISGDGKVIVTADNSGFVQTWHRNLSGTDYSLLWQYRVPPGVFTNWASSVGISGNGNTILAGSLLFTSGSTYDGSVMCFDTYGDGTPRWVFGGVGDLVDNISVSDDGRVASAVTWGDYPAHSKPDLLVFDVASGQVTFSVTTPGSFFTGDITPDGKRVFGGGKAVHAREFGNGGRIYLCEIELGGGHVSGTVDLSNTSDDSGVLVKANGTNRSALTDINGNYLIENIPAGTYTILAEKPGYNFGQVTNVPVSEGNTTTGVNMVIAPYPFISPNLDASTNLMGTILLSWSSLFKNPERENEIAKMVGDDLLSQSLNENSSNAINESGKSDHLKLLASSGMYGVDSVAIYRSLASGGPYARIASVSVTQSNYSDNDVVPLRNYYYVVNVFDNTGQSTYSNEALGRVSDSLMTFDIVVPAGSVPVIDGVISAGEWDDAFKVDISDIFGYGGGIPIPQGSVFMYFKYDDDNDLLYVAGEDFMNTTLEDNEGFGLYFDDNNNGVFDGTPPFVREGNFWAYWHPSGADLRFRELPSFVITPIAGAEVDFTITNGHLNGEVAIPMGFIEGYQLQVFSPDRTVGLGAFIIARQGTAAIFNGWWPQTMNTVFNPQYFGDVMIDASLLAPPQAPSNISVSRQGEDLLLTWDDPTLGINNDPLPVPPTINIYKNGEFLSSFAAGVESYLDSDVYCVAWYEYQLEAFIEVPEILTGPKSNPLGEFACEEPELDTISYDDGTWEAFYVPSFSWEENKWAVKFQPTTYPTTVRRVETTVNGNDAFDFTIQADNVGFPGDTLAGPYRVFDTNPATVGIVTKNLPGIDPPEITSGDFWVVINYLEPTPGAPGVGVDYSVPFDSRTFYYLTSSGWVNFPVGDLMLTAYVSAMPVGVEDEGNDQLPMTFDLKQNYPNPFNPSTVISYQLPVNETVNLEIYNALGQKVRTLVNAIQEAGIYNVVWDGKNDGGNKLSTGVYLYRISAGSFVKTMKMILLK